MQISVEHDLAELARWLDEASELTLQELESGVREAQDLYHTQVTEFTPKGVSGDGAAGLRKSITAHAPQIVDNGVIGLVSTNVPHALPVELGTKPHFPPIAPLEFWVQKKLGIDESESLGVAIAISKTIGKRGTKGVRMFERAYQATEGQMKEKLTLAVRRLADRLNNG